MWQKYLKVKKFLKKLRKKLGRAWVKTRNTLQKIALIIKNDLVDRDKGE
jgi:hypothetical protein|tara:strand:+ start:56 stop:202 length:147 start_codon:yes stop_codon:yes gene_type:complete